MTAHRVFVYGTLLSGEGNHAILDGAPKLCDARLLAGFAMYSLGGFPAIVRTIGNSDAVSGIVGEIYEVDDEALARLDRFEGVPSLYQRRTVDATSDAGPVAGPVWAYVMQTIPRHAGTRPIPSGSWRKFRGQR